MDAINLVFDPTPRPVSSYAELWGRDQKTLNRWCKVGWLPAFKHPSGEWWVRPLDLIAFDPHTLESQQKPTKRVRKGSNEQPKRLKYPGSE